MHMSYAFTPLDFACSHCNAVAGKGCKTRSGEIADYHKARIADFTADRDAYNLLVAEAQVMVPAITEPVRQLQENFRHKVEQADPTRRSARAQRDDAWRVEIQRVWDEHHQVYGPRK